MTGLSDLFTEKDLQQIAETFPNDSLEEVVHQAVVAEFDRRSKLTERPNNVFQFRRKTDQKPTEKGPKANG